MGKRKGRKEIAETPIPTIKYEESERDDDGVEEGKGGRFFACYLLTSLCPRFKGHTYIGFTVNPKRRIRQHNGEIGCGAWRTKRKRPWEMVVCIYGFPTNVAALQFEWAWQHPVESLAVRKAAATFKSLSGVANKIKLAFTMLTLPEWNSLNLTVNFFSTKYQKFMSGCPSLPEQMRTRVCIMVDLPCYNDGWDANEDFELSSQESIREEQVNDIQMNHKDDSNVASDEYLEETHEEFRWNLSPVREESSRQSNSFNVENSTLNGDFDSTNEQSISPLVFKEDKLEVRSPIVVNSSKIEVIDLFTPSPLLLKSCSKKRRPTVYPEIIDLTNSPLFV